MESRERPSMSELSGRIAVAKSQMPLGSKWLHYKGGKYLLMDYVIYEASGEVAIVYGSLDSPGPKFVRPLAVWQDMIEWEGLQVFRFQLISG